MAVPPHPTHARRDQSEPARSSYLRLVEPPASTLILIPCLDEAPRIAGVVVHLLDLYPGIDVLVVDDSSTDDTARVAQRGVAGPGRGR